MCTCQAKNATKEAGSPLLLTVMEKREAGYNPKNGGWSYAILSGDATQVQVQGKLSNCQNYHRLVNSGDYSFRGEYLPNEIYKQIFN